ncbi:DUF1273 domain-containing protein [Sutcliffiella cohnii]|uniref:DUF1273 domain-containing protein n=1 Tax=Sutcliffiella cohnii TaxID=33932 RepID=UPI002E22EE3E|nr:DUF1273 domain-containing protein [Sutcliffiella cohnii]
MKVMTLTGYKSHELQIFKNDDPPALIIKAAIRKKIVELLEEGNDLEWILISGQLGVELWGAEVVYELQEYYPQLKVAVITPFLGQEEKWSEANKEYYEFILSQADFIDSVSRKKYESPAQFKQKNLFFINKANCLLVVYDDERPGNTKFILEIAKTKAEKQHFPIYTIDFYELQVLMEEISYNQNSDW